MFDTKDAVLKKYEEVKNLHPDEIPFTRYFYKYEAPRPSEEIMAEIMELEKELSGSLEEVFC
ncbi:hypothetical protein [Lachnobacterium bovis]|uniref:hypothetical protein n=1 Tax=Lachnobacterium bovis TaxID=140626 RepID=UPI00048EA540|nr:hypothetical protein [Lachnobacterium bovis]